MRGKKKKIVIYMITALFLAGLLVGSYFVFRSPWKFREDRPIKILYINSYHSGFKRTDMNINAFKEYLGKQEINAEIREFGLNGIKNNSQENLRDNSLEAMEVIKEWQPDLIYLTDDYAQEHLGINYINSDIPLVFSGVDEDVEKYGYDKAKNIAGVLERLHVESVIEDMQKIETGSRNFVVIGDGLGHWQVMKERFNKKIQQMEGVKIVDWVFTSSFEDFKKTVSEYQEKADAFILLSVSGLKYLDGSSLPGGEVAIEWYLKNSNLPAVSFWEFYTENGILTSTEVSPIEQGTAAAKLVEEILIAGKRPSRLEILPTEKGIRNINLRRSEDLGLKIPSVILVNSSVFETFPWENKDEK